jgi:anti-anti-sigma factor
MTKLCAGSGEISADSATASLTVLQDGPGTFRLRGELDAAEVTGAWARLVPSRGNIEVDCANLAFIDASGLRLFIAVDQACRRRGGRLRIVNPSRAVMRLLELTGADVTLDVRPGGSGS